jgi:hypothetical protein
LGSGADTGPQPTAEAPAENVAAPPENGQAAAPQDLAGQTTTLTALGGVWLRITDGAGGPSLFTGILQTGQTFTVPATATRPLLRTGRPQMLRASAGGRDLGLIAPEERTVINVSLVPQDLAARAASQPVPAAPVAAAPAAPLAPTAARPRRTPAAAAPAPQQQPTAQPEAATTPPPPTPQ